MSARTGASAPGPARESPGATERLRALASALAVATPPALAAAWIASGPASPGRALAAIAAALGASLLLGWRQDHLLTRRLRTISGVLAAYRDGDFSIRARPSADRAGLVEVLGELNELGDELRRHRLGELEAWTLLRKVMAEVDALVLAFDEHGVTKLSNDAAARVLRTPASALAGRRAAELGLGDLLAGPVPRVVKDCPALGSGPFELRRGAFRLAGEPHQLVIVSDVSGALREQEREAWKRLIRVMGHEINNSLAPIRSISEGLGARLDDPARGADFDDDLRSGLAIIARRAEGLGRFMAAYAGLARLPPPELRAMDVASWVSRVVALERRLRVEVLAGPAVTLPGDPDQLDQLLINLLKNAVDASLEGASGPGVVRVGWSVADGAFDLTVEDEGPGVPDTANLFVPFFTTKPGGSGIGLALVRQIAEAHGGTASLASRTEGRGAVARVRLPVRAPAVGRPPSPSR